MAITSSSVYPGQFKATGVTLTALTNPNQVGTYDLCALFQGIRGRLGTNTPTGWCSMNLFREPQGITFLNLPGIENIASVAMNLCPWSYHQCATEQRILIPKVTSSFHG